MTPRLVQAFVDRIDRTVWQVIHFGAHWNIFFSEQERGLVKFEIIFLVEVHRECADSEPPSSAMIPGNGHLTMAPGGRKHFCTSICGRYTRILWASLRTQYVTN